MWLISLTSLGLLTAHMFSWHKTSCNLRLAFNALHFLCMQNRVCCIKWEKFDEWGIVLAKQTLETHWNYWTKAEDWSQKLTGCFVMRVFLYSGEAVADMWMNLNGVWQISCESWEQAHPCVMQKCRPGLWASIDSLLCLRNKVQTCLCLLRLIMCGKLGKVFTW